MKKSRDFIPGIATVCPTLSQVQRDLLLDIVQEGDVNLYGATKRIHRTASTIQGALNRLSSEGLIEISHTEKCSRGGRDKIIYTPTFLGFCAAILYLADKHHIDLVSGSPRDNSFLNEVFRANKIHSGFQSEVFKILPSLMDDLKEIFGDNSTDWMTESLGISCTNVLLKSKINPHDPNMIPDYKEDFEINFACRLLHIFEEPQVFGEPNHIKDQIIRLKKYPCLWAPIQKSLKYQLAHLSWIHEILEDDGQAL